MRTVAGWRRRRAPVGIARSGVSSTRAPQAAAPPSSPAARQGHRARRATEAAVKRVVGTRGGGAVGRLRRCRSAGSSGVRAPGATLTVRRRGGQGPASADRTWASAAAAATARDRAAFERTPVGAGPSASASAAARTGGKAGRGWPCVAEPLLRPAAAPRPGQMPVVAGADAGSIAATGPGATRCCRARRRGGRGAGRPEFGRSCWTRRAELISLQRRPEATSRWRQLDASQVTTLRGQVGSGTCGAAGDAGLVRGWSASRRCRWRERRARGGAVACGVPTVAVIVPRGVGGV